MKLEVATEPLFVATTTIAAIIDVTTIGARIGSEHPWVGATALLIIGILALAATRQLKPQPKPQARKGRSK